MSRTVPAQITTDINAGGAELGIFFDLNFSTPVYLWNGLGNRTLNGNVHEGVGQLISVSPMGEDLTGTPRECSITISGVDNDYNQDVLAEPIHGRLATVWLATQNATTGMKLFEGDMDSPRIIDDVEAGISTVSFTVQSRLVHLKKPKVERYTAADLQAKHATDSFFNYVQDLADKQVR